LTQASNTSAATQQTAAPGVASSSEASIIIVEFLGFGGSQGNDEESLQQGERRKSSENVAPVYNPRGPVRILGVGPLTDAEKQTLSESERQGL
jgi:hypothetical protein